LKSVASAPGKVILFGEHFVVYGLKAILGSIDRRVTVTSTKTDDKNIMIKSSFGQVNTPVGNYDQVKGSFRPFTYIAKKMIERFQYDGGLEIIIESNIPSGVGLGSSSACCVAAAGSISGLFSEFTKDEILNLAMEAERTIFQEASGADSTVSTYGGIIEYDKESGFNKIESSPSLHLVIANSKQTHSTSKVVSKVKRFKEENEQVFSELCENESKLIETVRQALKDNDLSVIGKCMSENQKYLEQIGVSNDKLQSMIKIAKETCYGAKLTGAGGGGCIIALTDESNLDKTLKKLQENNYECFSAKIDFTGLDTF
jgi:mevalonate kinase